VFLLRTAEPPIADVQGQEVRELRRIGKRIARWLAGTHRVGNQAPRGNSSETAVPRNLEELEALKRE